MGDDASQSYSGAIELRGADGRFLNLLFVRIVNFDAPVWSAVSPAPINLRDIDPGGETVMVRLADPASSRCGDVAAAHLKIREGRIELAGNYGFHAPDH